MGLGGLCREAKGLEDVTVPQAHFSRPAVLQAILFIGILVQRSHEAELLRPCGRYQANSGRLISLEELKRSIERRHS
jgi:hypothetical protein